MEQYSVVIILLAIAIGLLPVAKKIKFPYPVLLLVAGIIVGFIPYFKEININHEMVFLIFLPPILYDAAYHIPFKDFKRNLPVISFLAIQLVFLTTSVIAVFVHYMLGLDWALSFVLGAILSPPDAIAAAGVTKDLGLPHRANTILEGESLINDASALVAFRFAVAAVAGSQFIFWQAGLMFLVALLGGFILGWLLAHIFIFATTKLTDKNVIVALNLLLPFVAYLLAEEMHISGVIAVVSLGLMVSQHKDRLPENSITQSKLVLETVVFILSGLIFILIGLEFPQVLKNIPDNRFLPLIGCAFLIFIVALLIRILMIFRHKQKMEQQYKALVDRVNNINNEQLKKMPKRFSNKNAFAERIENSKSLLLNKKEALIIGWSGMRGIVSLAAALSLPFMMADGSDFPYRNEIIFLTTTVVIIMLIIQGLGLPFILKLLKINDKH